ncbi:MAG: NAD(P)/FAD-dependent oxidoreductase [bacterium]|nr:NAD(P)/FAD-dependent oxidoreductase [bacterium]
MTVSDTITANEFDVIVLGGGPAGVTAALRARELGATVALVERNLLGGTCTNDGCVPTRVLAKAARLMRDTQQFADYGLDAPKPTVSFAHVLERAQQVVYQVHEKKQLKGHLEDLQIATFENVGDARFIDSQRIQLADGHTLTGQKFVLCVGGHARKLDIPGGEHVWSHSDVWKLTTLPASIAIIGSGATGCQFASVFNTFGVRVILLDLAPRILPTEDSSVSELMTSELQERGIEIHIGIKGVNRIEKDGNTLRLFFTANGQEEMREVEAVMASVGWPGNLDSLNLEAAGVATQKSFIEVNDQLRTSVPHIYAAGDVTGRMMLVQTASDQARRAVENALLNQEQIDFNQNIPHGGFTDPEYAGVGLTEEQAQEKAECIVAIVPYADMDRAVIDGNPVGFCKLIVDRSSHLILGAHVVGEQAVEVVQMVTTAMVGRMTVEQVAEIEFAYPTFAAIIGLAARQLARDLQVVPVARPWRSLSRQRIAEWERRKTEQA